MLFYENATDGLRQVQAVWSKGCTGWVGFPTSEDKLEALAEKWAEAFGTRLPGHARHVRTKRGLPNAYAYAHPLHGGKIQVWLLRTAGFDASPNTPWSREKWISTPPIYGAKDSQLVMVREPRARGDYAWTWRMTDRHLNAVGSFWRGSVLRGNADGLAFDVSRTVSALPMFGGVRRQLLKELSALERLWKKKWPNRAWPGADVPMMGKFKGQSTIVGGHRKG